MKNIQSKKHMQKIIIQQSIKPKALPNLFVGWQFVPPIFGLYVHSLCAQCGGKTSYYQQMGQCMGNINALWIIRVQCPSAKICNEFDPTSNLGYALNLRAWEEITKSPETSRNLGRLMYTIAHSIHIYECM